MNREQFEKWARQNGYIVDAIDGNYQVSSTIHAWLAWQEQQKKIDEIVDLVSENTPTHYVDNLIKELLK